ncbi:MAG: toll/interleukin-1 receptor domain-containing protein [bacterium]|nr:toll/interleukin-1 receptor domain-containing protein [bacterium]
MSGLARPPKVFISYSWKNNKSSSQKSRVGALVERLKRQGIDVLWDEDLPLGFSLDYFMESPRNEQMVDKILVLSDAEYARKANEMDGGVGQESEQLHAIVCGHPLQTRVIAAYFDESKTLPRFLERRKAADFSTDAAIDMNFPKVVDSLKENGNPLTWFSTDSTADKPVFSQDDFMTRLRALHPDGEILTATSLLNYIDKMTPLRNEYILHITEEAQKGRPIHKEFCALLEKISCEFCTTAHNESRTTNYEDYEYFRWSLVISVIAVLFRLEKFEDIFYILTHSYFIPKSSFRNGGKEEQSIGYMTKGLFLLNSDDAKKIVGDYLSTEGELLIRSASEPYQTKEALVLADIMICQLCYIYKERHSYINKMWFSKLCCYEVDMENQWRRLKSRSSCESMLPLFGATDITELKLLLKNSPMPVGIKWGKDIFNNDGTPQITSFLDINEIATRP